MRIKLKQALIFGVISFLFSSFSSASVVITGTRVIYNASQKEKTVQLTNGDDFPYVIQSWIDLENSESSPENSTAPFLVSPPIFRIESGSGQNLRLVFTGDSTLPQDRESLFYLNVLQIPPRSLAKPGQNQMLLMLKNRLKIFYRPEAIPGNPEQLVDKLKFKLQEDAGSWHIDVENPTGYYASFANAALVINKKNIFIKPIMLPPHTKMIWRPVEIDVLPSGVINFSAQLINDYGARIDIIRKLDR